MLKTCFAAALLALPSVASAENDPAADNYFYFNNPSISRDRALADWDECRELGGVVRPPPAGYIYSSGAIGAGVTGFLQGLQQGAQRRHMTDAAIRKCMQVKGYRRYSMSKEEAQALYAGNWPQIRERLADRAIASTNSAMRLEP